MQANRFALALLLVGCSAESEKKLPSASFTPHLETEAAAVACGEDIAFYGAAAPDYHNAFAYDSDGRISNVTGVWLADNTTDTTTYTWSGDDLTHALFTSGWDGSTWALDATYDATNGLTNYTYNDAGDAWSYALSDFAAPYMPQREDISNNGQLVVGYDLAYTDGRLVSATPDDGSMATTWSYNDAAGTITANTGNGAFTSVSSYDPNDFRWLGSSWGGSDPQAEPGDESIAWNGNNLDTITIRTGAPLQVLQTSTYQYNCAAARQLAGQRVSRLHASFARANAVRN